MGASTTGRGVRAVVLTDAGAAELTAINESGNADDAGLSAPATA